MTERLTWAIIQWAKRSLDQRDLTHTMIQASFSQRCNPAPGLWFAGLCFIVIWSHVRHGNLLILKRVGHFRLDDQFTSHF
jgi:hypothetical protein